MHFLFVKASLEFPRRSGHDVHCFSMMRALASMGHSISFLSEAEVTVAAIDGVPCRYRETFGGYDAEPSGVSLGGMQERFRSYWGVSERNIAIVGHAARRWEADAVVVVGLDVLPYLSKVDGSVRIWYAADEWFLHHASLLFAGKPSTWGELKPAVIKGLYERAYASCVDRVWVVSDRDARAVRWVMGSQVDVAPNGVDFEHYRRPTDVTPAPRSCVFWGRLDFAPNIDAIEWFCEHVWTTVKDRWPDATFNVFGFSPGARVHEMAQRFAFELVPDLPDLRGEIVKNRVVVLPFVSGAGIKNKLLEAAALSMPVVASQRVVEGLRLGDEQPLMVAKRPAQWVDALSVLWDDDAARASYGRSARDWVTREYSWAKAAERVLEPLGAASPTRVAFPVPDTNES